MRKKIVFAGIWLIFLCIMAMPEIRVSAAEGQEILSLPEISEKSKTPKAETLREITLNLESANRTVRSDRSLAGETSVQSEPLGLFSTKYIVTAKKACMRSGPGYQYPVSGILYKNDILWVRSVRNGWARFKVNGRWRYISERSIKRETERVFWFQL